MLESQQKVAAVTAMEQADVTALVELREKIKAEAKERMGINVYKNVPGNFDQKLFESGVGYFK